jgi:ATP-dependent Clp protease ATP-binding subunit ClpB
MGSHILQEAFENAKESDYPRIAEKAKVQVLELLKQTIRPEFLNRIDETLLFLPLTRSNLKDIVQIQLGNLKAQLKEKGIKLFIAPDAFDYIVELGYDPFFGARPVKRVIQKEVLNSLSKALLAKTVDMTQTVVMDMFEGQIVFRKPVLAEEEIA